MNLQGEVMSSTVTPQLPRTSAAVFQGLDGDVGRAGTESGRGTLGLAYPGLGLGQRVWYIFIFPVPFAGGGPFSFLFLF